MTERLLHHPRLAWEGARVIVRPQVSAPAHAGVARARAGVTPGNGPGRLPYRLGEGHQIVAARRWRYVVAVVAHQVPAARRGQAAGVLLAQVVRVRLGEGRERADHRRGVGVDIGQRGDSRLRATVAGTTPW